MPLTESDKLTLTKYPALPSKCCVCFRSADGELDFLDFQMSVDIYGAVSICRDCLIPTCELLGYVPRDLLDSVAEQAAEQASVAESLRNEVARLDSAITTILDVRPNLLGNLVDAYEGAGETSESDNREAGEHSELSGQDDRESSESATERGPENPPKPSVQL